jgi:hypothetical protein
MAAAKCFLPLANGEKIRQTGDNAFHEKAGRSQVVLLFFRGQGFSPAELATDAILPSALW